MMKETPGINPNEKHMQKTQQTLADIDAALASPTLSDKMRVLYSKRRQFLSSFLDEPNPSSQTSPDLTNQVFPAQERSEASVLGELIVAPVELLQPKSMTESQAVEPVRTVEISRPRIVEQRVSELAERTIVLHGDGERVVNSSEQIVSLEAVEDFDAALAALNDRERDAVDFVMGISDGQKHTYDELAERLGIGTPRAYAIVDRAWRKLGIELEPEVSSTQLIAFPHFPLAERESEEGSEQNLGQVLGALFSGQGNVSIEGQLTLRANLGGSPIEISIKAGDAINNSNTAMVVPLKEQRNENSVMIMGVNGPEEAEIEYGGYGGQTAHFIFKDRRKNFRLSYRELQLLKLRASGSKNMGVADKAVISVRTVEAHWARIQYKVAPFFGHQPTTEEILYTFARTSLLEQINLPTDTTPQLPPGKEVGTQKLLETSRHIPTPPNLEPGQRVINRQGEVGIVQGERVINGVENIIIRVGDLETSIQKDLWHLRYDVLPAEG